MTFSVVAVLVFVLMAAPAGAETGDGCRDCHKDEKFRVQNSKIYNYYREWEGSAHDIAGLECTSCHNGDSGGGSKVEAHEGILPTSHAGSPVHYKNIPRTCGRCHEDIYKRFVKSRHYAKLKESGRGPNCITCHGSLNARTYYTTIFERACSVCHNSESGNHPEIVPQGKNILSRINHSKGYRTGLRFYYESIDKPQAMRGIDAVYRDIVRAWHQFDFKELDGMSKDLVYRLKTLYKKTQKERQSRQKDAPPRD